MIGAVDAAVIVVETADSDDPVAAVDAEAV